MAFRNSKVVKLLWAVMALYMLNISVDTADPEPENIPENLNFNDQESIVEIVVEQILGYEDAIKEYDDPDEGEQRSKTKVKIDLSSPFSQVGNWGGLHIRKDCLTAFHTPFIASVLREINTPPPEV